VFRRIVRALRSLRWRLTLAYVGLLAALLAALGAYQYIALRQSLIASRVVALQDDYNTARTVLARVSPGQSPLRGRALCGSAPRAAARAVATAVAQVSGHTVGVVVYGPSLVVASTAPANADLPQLDSARLGAALSGQRSSAQVISEPSGDQLVVGFPISTTGGVCGVAQLSVPMSSVGTVLADDVVFLGIGTGAALIVALLLGLFLTGRALRPLRRLTATAEQLAAGDLKARSRLTPRDDEVGALTRSFDNMADRIDESFSAQRESEAQTRRFIADASHELRTPVTALKGYIDVLRRGAGRDPQSLEAALESMGNEADRMRSLVLDLLTLARIDARRGVTLEVFDLNAELSRILDEGVAGMPDNVERQLTPQPLPVRADRTALETMVRNVLSNAGKYAPGAAQRWVTSTDGSRARIDAHDDGPGIAPADLPHVFERFYRGEKMRAREDGGSGLGLPIVLGLAHMQGGDVAVSSAEGTGTTVTIWLPLAN
jgi:two-component system OmpR family sensor kinase